MLLDDGVVAAVKVSSAPGIHFHECCSVVEASAFGLQEFSIGCIQRRVLITLSGEVVEPVAEGWAAAYSNCVSTYVIVCKIGQLCIPLIRNLQSLSVQDGVFLTSLLFFFNFDLIY